MLAGVVDIVGVDDELGVALTNVGVNQLSKLIGDLLGVLVLVIVGVPVWVGLIVFVGVGVLFTVEDGDFVCVTVLVGVLVAVGVGVAAPPTVLLGVGVDV